MENVEFRLRLVGAWLHCRRRRDIWMSIAQDGDTPWANLTFQGGGDGHKKGDQDHSTIGLVVTTDGYH